MDHKQVGVVLIFFAVIVMVIAQLVLKHSLNNHGAIPFRPSAFWPYALALLRDWLVWLGGAGLVASALMWYAAVSRLPISFAFPFAAMSYPMIFAAAVIFLGESFSYMKLLANMLIVSGVILIGLSSS